MTKTIYSFTFDSKRKLTNTDLQLGESDKNLFQLCGKNI